jgi:hypothetical protein
MYTADDWYNDPDRDDWQKGMCDTYTKAMLDAYPHLRMGLLINPVTGIEQHYFAHDDDFAYDSIGRHPLPYTGYGENAGQFEQMLDQDPKDYGIGSHYPYGENAGPEDYERARRLVPLHHPDLGKTAGEVIPMARDGWSYE